MSVNAKRHHAMDDTAASATVYERILRSSLTESERSIARILTVDYPQAALLSARDIAAAARVSAPSVTRLAAKLGYSSFLELQRELRDELRASLSSPSSRMRGSAGASPRLRDRVAAAFDLDIQNIEATKRNLSLGNFEGIVTRLRRPTGSIYVVGGRKAHPVATYFAIQLEQLRPHVVLLPESDVLPQLLTDVRERDALVAFVPRRLTRRVAAVVNEFHRRGAVVAAICDAFPSPVIQDSSYLITVRTDSHTAFDSYTAFVTVANALLAGLLTSPSQPIRDRLDEVERLSEEFGLWSRGRLDGDIEHQTERENDR